MNGSNAEKIKVYFSDDVNEVSSMDENALLADEYTLQALTVEDLTTLTTYYWKVIAGNNMNELLASSATWHFTTNAEEGSIVIGNGTATDVHLPMEPFYGYSMSQTIYDQELLNIEDQRIEEISYYYNGIGAWTEDNIQIAKKVYAMESKHEVKKLQQEL